MSRESIIHSCLGRLQVTKSTTSADRGADTDAETAGGGDGRWKMESLDLWQEQSIMQSKHEGVAFLFCLLCEDDYSVGHSVSKTN